jgi:predicted PhzF superfamily epimerase YddE/YHI9
MTSIRLGERLIHAFSDGERGGNPSFVIATEGVPLRLDAQCIDEAKRRGCEVTHLHFGENPHIAFVRFYVAAGSLSFCGHGALAAAAWSAAAGRAHGGLLLDFGTAQLHVEIDDDKQCFSYPSQAGRWSELTLTNILRDEVLAILGLSASPVEGMRVWLGGAERAKALIALPRGEWLSKLRVEIDLRDAFCRQHGVTGIYPFMNSDDGGLAARHFALDSGGLEDMATGNIAATVAALVTGSRPRSLTIAQGGPQCDVAFLRLSPRDGEWLISGSCRVDPLDHKSSPIKRPI